jgi:hypothetical protein
MCRWRQTFLPDTASVNVLTTGYGGCVPISGRINLTVYREV